MVTKRRTSTSNLVEIYGTGLNRFNITAQEFYDRDSAFRSRKYDCPNFVIAYGDEDNYTEGLYFDGDGGKAIIKNGSEVFPYGSRIELHECNYCDFDWSVIKNIFDILIEIEE